MLGTRLGHLELSSLSLWFSFLSSSPPTERGGRDVYCSA